jgi:DNA primase
MKIPEDQIERIREATDIQEVISRHVTLKRRGKSLVGLCPFHSEKTPSFTVDPARGFYHCFGCGVGGNVFSFVMQMEKIGFVDAAKVLAQRAGIELSVEEDDGRAHETESLYAVNRFAQDYFRSAIQAESGKKALGYISNRGFPPEILERFAVGYAPDARDGLIAAAKRAAFDTNVLVMAGLLGKRDDGSVYDRFRGRLMFPILNASGRPIAFGGRVIDGPSDAPKYLNSPETGIYQKSHVLYGIHQALAGIRREDRAVLVEGYTDCMRLHQCGYDYTVATAGTALTEQQAHLISRYTRRVTLVYDGDAAGYAAAMRGIDILVSAGLRVEVAELPQGTDPDSLGREGGRPALESVFESGKPFVEFMLDRFKQEGRLDTPGDRAAAARIVLAVIQKIKDAIERNLMIRELAGRLDLPESILLRESKPGRTPDSAVQSAPVKPARELAERGILSLLLEDGNRWGRLLFRFVHADMILRPENRRLFDLLYERFIQNRPLDPQSLSAVVQDSGLESYLAELAFEPIGETTDRCQFGLDCIINLKREEFRERIQTAKSRIRTEQTAERDASIPAREYETLRQGLEQTLGEVSRAWKKEVEI